MLLYLDFYAFDMLMENLIFFLLIMIKIFDILHFAICRMSTEKTNIVVAFLTLLICHKFAVTANKTVNIWRTAGQLTGLLFNKCLQPNLDLPQEQFLLILQECLKRRSLLVLDRSLESDVIKIASGIELVRYRHDNDSEDFRYCFTRRIQSL